MSFFTDNPLFADIQSFVTSDILELDSSNYYVLDNNVLTELALLAKKDTAALSSLLSSFLKDSELIIPEPVLEESVRNVTDIRHFNNLYLNFFMFTSQHISIHILSFEDCFNLISEGFTNHTLAFHHFREVALNSTENIEIRQSLRKAETLADIDVAYRQIKKDMGERYAFLFSHCFIMEGATQVILLSNEIRGVYNKVGPFSQNQTLRSLIYIINSDAYVKKLKVVTYNYLLFHYIQTLNPSLRVDYLNIARTGRSKDVTVKYAYKTENVLCESTLNNEEFVELNLNADVVFYY